jgi:hypothetical protein
MYRADRMTGQPIAAGSGNSHGRRSRSVNGWQIAYERKAAQSRKHGAAR